MKSSVGTRVALPVAVGLLLLTLATFWEVRRFDFVNYDDLEFIVENPRVSTGLTAANVREAFANPYWATGGPLTWLSHLADVEVYGLDAGGHHVTSLILHAANTLLLFGWLWSATGATGRSAFTAALFAVHPLHVESVAWVSQRKDVLSTMCWLLALWAYLRYVRKPAFGRYAAVAGLFLLGLLSKPMVVTFPFVLLLLDVWPLGRLAATRPLRPQLWRLGLEKLPLVALSAAAGALTLASQRALGAVSGTDVLPLADRVSNALVSYAAYIGRTLWPVGLVPFYPYREALSAGVVVACALFLAGMTVIALAVWRRSPFVAVGWLWYAITLVPVIGIVQVGAHAMADRFTYVPLVGLFIAVAWAGQTLAARFRVPARLVALTCVCVVAACASVARAQARHWRDGVALWEHTVRVAPQNARAHANLGVALARRGDDGAAIEHYGEALRLAPSAEAHNNLALALTKTGRSAEAVDHAAAAVRLKPDYADARSNLASLLAAGGRTEEAIGHYAIVVRQEPDLVRARIGLALALRDTDRPADALPHVREAIRLEPGDARWRYLTGVLLVDLRRPGEAVAEFEAALRLDPSHEAARRALELLKQG